MAEMENIAEQIEELKTTGTAQLLVRYKELFGDKTAPGNRPFLIRQSAYRGKGRGKSEAGELRFGALRLAAGRPPAPQIGHLVLFVCGAPFKS